MLIQDYPKHLFWNYQSQANLPESIVAGQVLEYGDIEDITLLFQQVPQSILLQSVEKMKQCNRWKKRVNFIEKVFLDKTQ